MDIFSEDTESVSVVDGLDYVGGPIPLNAKNFTQKPLNLALLPTLIGDAVAQISSTVRASTDMAVFAVLAASAYAVQLHHKVGSIGGMSSEEPCAVNTLIIAKSGDRKSSVDSLAWSPIHDWEQECLTNRGIRALFTNGLENGERFFSTPILYANASMEAVTSGLLKDGFPAVAFKSDEGAVFFGGCPMRSSNLGAILADITKLWDSACIDRFRVSDPKSSGKRFNRACSINLMVQPVAVRDALGSELLQGQGFLPRMLVAFPQSLMGTRFLTLNSDGKIETGETEGITRYHKRTRELLAKPVLLDNRGGLIQSPVLFDQGATRCLVEYANAMEQLSGDEEIRDTPFVAFVARAAQQARRVAVVLTVMVGQETVDGQLAASAVAIVNHSLKTWRSLLGHSKVEQLFADAQKIIVWLQKNPSASFRDIQRGPRISRSDANYLCEVLELLDEYRHLKFIRSSRSITEVCQATAR